MAVFGHQPRDRWGHLEGAEAYADADRLLAKSPKP
jgi:hypothetical protein